MCPTDKVPSEAPRPLPQLSTAIDQTLRALHRRNAAKAVQSPEADGDFWPYNSLLRPNGIPPIVPDANVLKNDISRACRQKGPTVLVNGANNAAFRLFCAEHVIEEVYEHGPEWAESKQIGTQEFMARWESEYLPLIRVVKRCELLEDLLTADERTRISILKAKDPDDVPSACLSLVLGAFYLTQDNAALTAAYGTEFNQQFHYEWLKTLQAGGNASELDKVIYSMAVVPSAAVTGAVSVGKWAVKNLHPLILITLFVGGCLVIKRLSPETRAAAKRSLSTILDTFGETIEQQKLNSERFLKAGVQISSWASLAESTGNKSSLTRASVYALARSARGHQSARELSEALPNMGVGQGESAVRSTLRSNEFFYSPLRGRWQLGNIATPHTV